MPRNYAVNGAVRAVNRLVGFMLRTGLAANHDYLLTVVGRKTGKPYSTPVTTVRLDGRRYLVAPYGEVAWVKNARAAGKVRLSRKGSSEQVGIEAVSAREAAPVLKAYVGIAKVTRPYFEVKADAAVEEFEAIAPNHPVFLIQPI